MAKVETALAVVETIVAVDFFKAGASAAILDKLETDVRALAADMDISTYEGREAIRSLAAKIATTKNGLEKAGKELVDKTKKEVKLVDIERGLVWDRVQALQDEVRKPLTDFENAEKDRVAKHEAALAALIEVGTTVSVQWEIMALQAMKDKLAEIQGSQYEWEEFQARAVAAVRTTISQILDAIARREKLESDREELERLRVAQAERDQADLLERTAREATEAAERAAGEREAVAAREASEREAAAQRERDAAVERAEQAERDRVADAEQAQRDQEAAVEAERVRAVSAAAQIAETERLAAEKRESNRKHSAKINREVRDALMVSCTLLSSDLFTSAVAEELVAAIAKGLIPHTKISY